MRKLLLLLLVAVTVAPAFGQNSAKNASGDVITPMKQIDVTAEGKSVVNHEHEQMKQWRESAAVNIIWEEDFSNGVPGTWTNAGKLDPNTNQTSLWEYRGVSTNPDTSVGTRGAYGLNRRIESPTWMNGFVIFDSDYYDNGGTPGAFGNGPVPTHHWGSLETETLDLSGDPNVVLEFYQMMRQFNSLTYVVFSRDGGATYPDTAFYNDEFPITTNLSTAADDYVATDVSAVIGGESMARIKFVYQSDPDVAPPNTGYYFWQLDDIRLISTPNNDLAVLDVGFSNSGRDISYQQIPWHQSGDVEFVSLISNNGVVDQPNTAVTVDVQGPATYNNTTSGFLAESDSAYIITNQNLFTASAMGQYAVTFSVASDSTDEDPDPTGFRDNNNEMVRTFTVTDSALSVTEGASNTSLGTGSFTNASDGVRYANLLEITDNSAWITSVTIGLSQGRSRVGGTVEITIRDTMPGFVANITSDFANVVCRSDFYTITLQDSLNGFATIPIPAVLLGTPQNRELTPDWYIVSAELYSNSDNNPIYILDDWSFERAWYASFFYYPPNGRWFSNGNAFHITPNVQDTNPIGIEEKSLDVRFDLFPNPAKDVVEFRAQTDNPVDFQVVITNISGQTIKTDAFGRTTNLVANMDISDLAAGIYVVNIQAGDESIVRKLVIE